jgi:hypothetical protein
MSQVSRGAIGAVAGAQHDLRACLEGAILARQGKPTRLPGQVQPLVRRPGRRPTGEPYRPNS